MGKIINIVGQRFGLLLVSKYAGKSGRTTLWECVCECGNIVISRKSNLTSGNGKSCGCLRKKLMSERLKLKLQGMRFQKIVALEEAGRNKHGQILWKCKCDCGAVFTTEATRLKDKESCGCEFRKKQSERQLKDLTNIKMDKLLIIERLGKSDSSRKEYLWKCLCDCGKESIRPTSYFTRQITKSCGCLHKKRPSIDDSIKVGQKFNRLTISKRDEINNKWLCQCDCGNTSSVKGHNLVSNRTKSCGCVQIEEIKKICGPKHPNWNPNKSTEERQKERLHRKDHDYNFKIWSKQIKIRDDYTCQICNQRGGKLRSHHLNCWHSFVNERYDLKNGICTCFKCHQEFHSIYGLKTTKEMFVEHMKNLGKEWIV